MPHWNTQIFARLGCRPSLVLVVLVLLLTSCATSMQLPQDVTTARATWLWGIHAIPASATKDGVARTYRLGPDSYPEVWTEHAARDVKSGVQVPAVVYLHGCAGLRDHDGWYRILLLAEGFAVFQPNSLVYRSELCHSGGMTARVWLRHQEVVHALHSIRQLSWVNQERLVLMGFSEGGQAVAAWWKRGFMAHIVLGTNCKHNAGNASSARGVPVLVLVGADDHLYGGLPCGVSTRAGGKSLVIANAAHNIAYYPQTQVAIREFLQTCCQ
jgi:dienelactone hydrolase